MNQIRQEVCDKKNEKVENYDRRALRRRVMPNVRRLDHPSTSSTFIASTAGSSIALLMTCSMARSARKRFCFGGTVNLRSGCTASQCSISTLR